MLYRVIWIENSEMSAEQHEAVVLDDGRDRELDEIVAFCRENACSACLTDETGAVRGAVNTRGSWALKGTLF